MSNSQRTQQILRKYSRLVRATVARHAGTYSDLCAEDIEQEVYLKLIRVFNSERKIEHTTSYIQKVTISATIDAIRRAARRPVEQSIDHLENREVASVLATGSRQPDMDAEQSAVLVAIEEAMEALPENRKVTVRLHLQGFTTTEIAGLLGWTEPKARNLASRGMKSLREALARRGIEYEVD